MELDISRGNLWRNLSLKYPRGTVMTSRPIENIATKYPKSTILPPSLWHSVERIGNRMPLDVSPMNTMAPTVNIDASGMFSAERFTILLTPSGSHGIRLLSRASFSRALVSTDSFGRSDAWIGFGVIMTFSIFDPSNETVISKRQFIAR